MKCQRGWPFAILSHTKNGWLIFSHPLITLLFLDRSPDVCVFLDLLLSPVVIE